MGQRDINIITWHERQNEAFAFGEEFPVEMILQAQAARDVIEKRQRRHRIHPPFQGGQHEELHFLYGFCVEHELSILHLPPENQEYFRNMLNINNLTIQNTLLKILDDL